MSHLCLSNFLIGSGHYASLYNHSYIFNKYVYTSLTSPWVPKNMLTNWSRQTDGNSLRYILWETSYVWGWYIGRTLLRMNVCETSYVMSNFVHYYQVCDSLWSQVNILPSAFHPFSTYSDPLCLTWGWKAWV